MKAEASVIDPAAIAISSLCLVHCLALPVISAFLPLAGALADVHWLHQVFALFALPLTFLALMRHGSRRAGFAFSVPAIIGLSLLLAAAFAEPLHELEVPLTTAGALLLAAAHLFRWARSSR